MPKEVRELIYSFDDQHIGRMLTGSSTLHVKQLARPEGLTQEEWYRRAGAACRALNGEEPLAPRDPVAEKKPAMSGDRMTGEITMTQYRTPLDVIADGFEFLGAHGAATDLRAFTKVRSGSILGVK